MPENRPLVQETTVFRVERLNGEGRCLIRGFFLDRPTADSVRSAFAEKEGREHTVTSVPLSEALAVLNDLLALRELAAGRSA